MRLQELPQIVIPKRPPPPKEPETKPDEQKPEPSAFVVRGAHNEAASDGSIHPPSSRGASATRAYGPVLPIVGG